MFLASEYRNWLLASDLSPSTINQRVAFAHRWHELWGGTFHVSAARSVEWLQQFRGWTKRTYVANLRSLYRWLQETDQVTTSPIERVRSGPTPRPNPQPLPPDQLEAVLGNAQGRLLAFLLLGYLAGLRCFEIAKFHGSDINESSIYVCGKGGAEWVLPTHPVLWALAQQLPRDDYWFPSPNVDRDHISKQLVEKDVRAHFRACGVETGAVHRLRHSYGTALDRAGVRPRIVQELMRHASLNTTMRYTLVEHTEKLRDVQRLPLPSIRVPGGDAIIAAVA